MSVRRVRQGIGHGVQIEHEETWEYKSAVCDCCQTRTRCRVIFYYIHDLMQPPLFARMFFHDMLCKRCVPSDAEIVSRLLARTLTQPCD